MNLLNDIRREIILTILVVIGITITFFGLTYAVYFTIDEKDIGAVSVGLLGFDMCVDENCTDYGSTYGTTITGEIYPMNTTEGTSQTPYKFKMSTSNDQGIYVRVYAAIEQNSNIDYSHIKYAYRMSGGPLTYGTFTTPTVTLYNDYYLEVEDLSEIIDFYVWLDEEAENDVIGKTVSIFVNAMGYYKPSDPNNLHTSDVLFANTDASFVNGQTFSYSSAYRVYTASLTGYYYIEAYGPKYNSVNGEMSSGYIYLLKDEKLYIYTGTGNQSTDVRYFSTTPSSSDLGQSSTTGLRARILTANYGGATNSFGSGTTFISGYAGTNAVNSSGTTTNNTIHFSGKYFLGGNINELVNSGDGKVYIRYAGVVQRLNTKLDSVRYIKDCINGSSANTPNHWVEIQAIKDGTNLAKGKTVTGTVSAASGNAYTKIVDGLIGSSSYGKSSSNGLQCVTVNLGAVYNLDEIAVWHYYSDGRTYNNNITSVSSDNSTWTELINMSAPETQYGKRISAY